MSPAGAIATLTSTTGATSTGGVRPAPVRGATLGRYVVLDLIGAGAMGAVYRAYDFGLDRRVCLKLVASARGAAAQHRQERLITEARAVARLNHPNVVTVHDVGTCDGQVFVAMELVEGPTLQQWLRAQDRSAKEILQIFEQAACGLEAAHAAGLVHRDFKPDNVLVGADGRVRIADFGLALAPGEDGAPGGSGTPVYMAPEQHRREPVTAAADQYAFAVALHEALAGTRPFVGASEPELLEAKVQRRLRPGPRPMPRRVARVLQRALAPDPRDRFASMTALRTALRARPHRALPTATGLTTAVLATALFLAAPAVPRPSGVMAQGDSRSTSRGGVPETAARPRRRPERVMLPALPSADPVPFSVETERSRQDGLASTWAAATPADAPDPFTGLLLNLEPVPATRRGVRARATIEVLDPVLAFLEQAELDAWADALRAWLDDGGPAFAGYASVSDDAAALRALQALGGEGTAASLAREPAMVSVNVAAAEQAARRQRIRTLEAQVSAAKTPEERAQAQFELAQELWELDVDRQRAIELAREAQLTLTLDGRTATDLLDDVNDWLDENGPSRRGDLAW